MSLRVKGIVLPAGRLLNDLVAERVFGLCMHNRWPGGFNVACPDCGANPTFGSKDYSTDMAAAWTILDKLNNDGHWLFILCQPHDGNMPTVLGFICGARPYPPTMIYEHIKDEIDFALAYQRPLVRVGADTMPLAICRAALEALEGN